MNVLKPILIACILILSNVAWSQVVTVNPTFPGPDETITVTFDATKGNAGLKGVSQVYIHAGLVTDKSQGMGWRHVVGNWGQDDPKVKMTKIGTDKHMISYNIREFHNLPQSEQLKYLAFVFRNVDGSKEGKTESNGDIFISASSGVNSGFIRNSPQTSRFIAKLNSTIKLDYTLESTASITVHQNGSPIYNTTSKSLNFNINVNQTGNYTIIVEATSGSETYRDSLKYAVFEKDKILNLPPNVRSGVNIVADKVILAFEAPEKEYAYVMGNFNNWIPDVAYQMNRTQDGRTWWIEMNKPEDRFLVYKFILPAGLEVADPYATMILDEDNDTFIADQSSFPKFPTEVYGRASCFDLQNPTYTWKYDDVKLPNKEKLVIYELLMRDFLKDHSYKSLLDTLSYLKALGVNAIELMPVNEFEGNISWGYNTSFHMALDKYYGSENQFKAMIDEAHKMGMAVILDVVYNHAFSQSPLARMYWDAPSNRPAMDNPWLNPVARHPFNVGYDFNHESIYTRQYVKRTLAHWIEEFHLDGFRFDLSKGFTQKFSEHDGTFRMYDQSRINILNDYAQHAWSMDSNSYLILEHFADNVEEETLSDLGFMIWNNLNHEFISGCQGFDSDFSALSYKSKGWSDAHAVGYMESHDEERISYQVQVSGNSNSDYNTRDFDTTLERLKLGALFFFAVPGPKMMWQFGELAYDFSINTCENGTISQNCRLSPKPILWSDFTNAKRRTLFDFYSEIIHLRNKYSLFYPSTFFMSTSSKGKVIRLFNEEEEEYGIVIGNFDIKPLVITPLFQSKGMWYDHFSNTEKMVTDQLEKITLQPGEFKLYTNFKMTKEATTPIVELNDNHLISIFPNPWNDQLSIQCQSCKIRALSISDLTGKRIHQETFFHGVSSWTWRGKIDSGIYFLTIHTGDGTVYAKKIIKM